MRILFIQCGGTIDKCYPRMTKGYAFEFGDFSATQEILNNEFKGMINFEPIFITVCKKDSTDMDNNDRNQIIKQIQLNTMKFDTRLIIITHGTDTMIETAKYLSNALKCDINKYCICLTGSMKPAKFITSDAKFNLGLAVATIQLMHNYNQYGVYVTMNGRVFPSHQVTRNYHNGLFISTNSKL